MKPKVFGVDMTFLAAADVFRTGLDFAAKELDIEFKSMLWDDPAFQSTVEDFAPDLMLVIHGRSFAKQWAGKFDHYKKALWLVDEPYEVDSSVQYSPQFDFVFLNDSVTLDMHRNAHYLPTCYDPNIHHVNGAERIYKAGFIGGHNSEREEFLKGAARAGHLDYVIGGPWRHKSLKQIWKAHNVRPHETAAMYQQSKIIINAWRLNTGRKGNRMNLREITPYSMNPRVYESLACGALCVSEWRPEIDKVFPDLPTFDTRRELVTILDHLLSDPEYFEAKLSACRARLSGHTYADRLRTVLKVCLGWEPEPPKDGFCKSIISQSMAY